MRLIKTLPDPFVLLNGQRVSTLKEWDQRRLEIRHMMIDLQYGSLPGAPENISINCLEKNIDPHGNHTQKYRMVFIPKYDRSDTNFFMDFRVTNPSPSNKNNNFNKTISSKRFPTLIYVGNNTCKIATDNGFKVISFDNSQLEEMEMGRPIVGRARKCYDIVEPGRYSWGSISAWAWGAIRLVDYALTMDDVDPDKIIISGHSRNGKTALLAGALDERIAIVNPAGSGCAGAGSYLALGANCENLKALTDKKRWRHWMHKDFRRWADHEKELPFDQHFLMGLVAPRPLLLTEGSQDYWANPLGTCVTHLATRKIYDFFGSRKNNGIFFHEGGHDHSNEDFAALVDFANLHFFSTPNKLTFDKILPEVENVTDLFLWQTPEKKNRSLHNSSKQL